MHEMLSCQTSEPACLHRGLCRSSCPVHNARLERGAGGQFPQQAATSARRRACLPARWASSTLFSMAMCRALQAGDGHGIDQGAEAIPSYDVEVVKDAPKSAVDQVRLRRLELTSHCLVIIPSLPSLAHAVKRYSYFRFCLLLSLSASAPVCIVAAGCRAHLAPHPAPRCPPCSAAQWATGSGLHHSTPYLARITCVKELHARASDRSCVHVEVDVSGSDITYEAGGVGGWGWGGGVREGGMCEGQTWPLTQVSSRWVVRC